MYNIYTLYIKVFNLILFYCVMGDTPNLRFSNNYE